MGASTSPGRRSDATKVKAALREQYDGWDKARIRRKVALYLARRGVTVALDYWGGNLSREAILRAGVERVIAYEDGSIARTRAEIKKGFGHAVLRDANGDEITRERLRLALKTLAADDPDLRLGRLTDRTPQARLLEVDGGWADTCQPYGSGLSRLLRKLRHVKALAVTVLLEEMPKFSLDDRATIVADLLARDTGLDFGGLADVYLRPNGHPVGVFYLRASGRWRRGGYAQYVRETEDRRGGVTKQDPERRRRSRQRRREWMSADPVFAAAERGRAAARRQERSASDPAFYAAILRRSREQRARTRTRMEADPEYAAAIREVARLAARRYRARQKAARAGEPAS